MFISCLFPRGENGGADRLLGLSVVAEQVSQQSWLRTPPLVTEHGPDWSLWELRSCYACWEGLEPPHCQGHLPMALPTTGYADVNLWE